MIKEYEIFKSGCFYIETDRLETKEEVNDLINLVDKLTKEELVE